MNLVELQRALRQLRLGGIATVLETRLRQAQAETMAPMDLISCLVNDELSRRSDRLLERRRKQAAFRDPLKTLDNFDFTFNPKMNRSLVFDLATCAFIARREDGLFLGPGGTGKSHLAQAIGQAAILQGYRVLYRETHVLLDELAEAVIDAGAIRFRPMLLTAAAVVVGASVILSDPIFQGLALSLIAGAVASTFLSWPTIPVLYYMVHAPSESGLTCEPNTNQGERL